MLQYGVLRHGLATSKFMKSQVLERRAWSNVESPRAYNFKRLGRCVLMELDVRLREAVPS